MSLLEHNIRTAIFYGLLFVGAVWVGFDTRKEKSKFSKITILVFVVLGAIACVSLLIGTVSISDKVTDRGKIIDVSVNGSMGGYTDTYDVKIERSDGTTESYSTAIYTPHYLKDDVEKLKIGDVVEIYSNNFWNIFYRFKKINSS